MNFSKKEITDLIKAWAVVTLIFTVAQRSLYYLPLAAFGVGIAFLFHELAHKYTAEKYGLKAHFQAYDKGLLVSFLLSLFGLILIAPGAVVIPHMSDRVRAGRIAASGPIMNLILAIVMSTLYFFIPYEIFIYGAYINSFLALFNLIPIAIFDGKKVRRWNKTIHTFLLISSILLIFITINL